MTAITVVRFPERRGVAHLHVRKATHGLLDDGRCQANLIKPLDLESRGIVTVVDLDEVLHAINAGGEEMRVAQLLEDRLSRRRNVDLARAFHVAASSGSVLISAAIRRGFSRGVRRRARGGRLECGP